MTSNCKISVNVNDFSCTCMRKLVFDRLNAYFAPSDYISKNGNVTSYENLGTEWLTVTRQNVNSIIYGNYTTTSPFSNKNCTQMPSGINVWFLYAQVGKERGQTINEILATYIK